MTRTVTAVSILQPWAAAIIHGTKRIENRTWQTHHRGELAIHTGRSRREVTPETYRLPVIGRLLPLDDGTLVFGAIIGTVQLVDCVRLEDLADDHPVLRPEAWGGWAFGPWCWILRSPRPITPPIPWRGERMLFQVQIPAPPQ